MIQLNFRMWTKCTPTQVLRLLSENKKNKRNNKKYKVKRELDIFSKKSIVEKRTSNWKTINTAPFEPFLSEQFLISKLYIFLFLIFPL